MTEPRSERDTHLAYLRHLRREVVRTLRDLDEEQVRRPGVPSGTSLLGIVHHLTGVEQHWFERVFLTGDAVERDTSFAPPAGATVADVVAAYEAAGARSDEIVLAADGMEQLAAIANPGEEGLDTLRTITVHLVEETARHAGQADVLREMLDGVTND